MVTGTQEIGIKISSQLESEITDPPITQDSTAWLVYLALRRRYWELKLKFQEN